MSSLAWRLSQSRGEPINTASPAPVKDQPYEHFIRTLPCAACRREGVQAAHLNGKNRDYGHNGRGMSSRASSCWVLPQCERCHAIQTAMGNSGEGEARYWHGQQINPHRLASVLYARWNEHKDNPEYALELCIEIISRAKAL